MTRIVGSVRANINIHKKIDRAIAFVTEDDESSYVRKSADYSPVTKRNESSLLLKKERVSASSAIIASDKDGPPLTVINENLDESKVRKYS